MTWAIHLTLLFKDTNPSSADSTQLPNKPCKHHHHHQQTHIIMHHHHQPGNRSANAYQQSTMHIRDQLKYLIRECLVAHELYRPKPTIKGDIRYEAQAHMHKKTTKGRAGRGCCKAKKIIYHNNITSLNSNTNRLRLGVHTRMKLTRRPVHIRSSELAAANQRAQYNSNTKERPAGRPRTPLLFHVNCMTNHFTDMGNTSYITI
jgi:hypothetical protein